MQLDEINNKSNYIISINHVGKLYKLFDKPIDRLKHTLFWRFGKNYGYDFWALRDVTIQINRGDTIGILGRNGAGKSTLLQIVAGVLQPTEGEIFVNGKVSALLELGSGFNIEYNGVYNIYMNGAILGFSKEYIDERYKEIVDFADIGDFINQPIKTYSSGMIMRLAFAVASCLEPDILIVDEALAVGDLLFQAKCYEKIRKLRENGITTLFVTHDSGTFQNICNYGYILEKGQVFAQGKPSQVALQYYELLRTIEHGRQKISDMAKENDKQPIIEKKAEIEEETAKINREIQNKTLEGEYRFGTGGAKIIDYALIDQNGRENNSIKTGTRFSVILRIEIYEKINNLTCAVLFRNPQGQNLLGLHSYHQNRIYFGELNPGEFLEVICTGEMLLNPGEYIFNLSIADHQNDYIFKSLDSRNNLGKITVLGEFPVYYGLIQSKPEFKMKKYINKQN